MSRIDPHLRAAAPHPVTCPTSPSGKHWPRTVEGITQGGIHIKTSVCRHCERVA